LFGQVAAPAIHGDENTSIGKGLSTGITGKQPALSQMEWSENLCTETVEKLAVALGIEAAQLVD